MTVVLPAVQAQRTRFGSPPPAFRRDEADADPPPARLRQFPPHPLRGTTRADPVAFRETGRRESSECPPSLGIATTAARAPTDSRIAARNRRFGPKGCNKPSPGNAVTPVLIHQSPRILWTGGLLSGPVRAQAAGLPNLAKRPMYPAEAAIAMKNGRVCRRPRSKTVNSLILTMCVGLQRVTAGPTRAGAREEKT